MADKRPLLLRLYLGAARAVTPLFHVLFWLRCRSGKEISARKGERFGKALATRPDGHVIWIHAASVGETTSVLPLIEVLVERGHRVLLTTVTVTASELAAQRLPKGAIHQFAPYDAPGPWTRFLAHWSPDLAMVVESEIWPCLFDRMRNRETPFVLLNGRLSDKSLRNWEKVPATSRYVFNCLDMVLAQNQADANRFTRLGCETVKVPGNLKFDAAEPDAAETAVNTLEAQIGARKVWLAALTHPEEDEIVFDAFDALRQTYPDLLLILVPRHPARAPGVRDLAVSRGLSVVLRSSSEPIGDAQVYLGDTLGEMGLYYRLAPVTFLGGSYNEVGGHNPVEAALAGSALVTGPNVANARAVYKDFWNGGAALRVGEPAELAVKVGSLMGDPERVRIQTGKARELVEAGRGALKKSLVHLQPYLESVDGNVSSEAEDEQIT